METRVDATVLPGVWERAIALSTGALREVARALNALLAVSVVGIVVSSIAALILDAGTAWIITLASAGVIVVATAVLFSNASLRASTELVIDHGRIERRDWRLETGTRRPRARKAIERWLRENPDALGRAGLLVQLGRFEEADRELERRPYRGADGVFAIESDRQYRTMFTGGRPDFTVLRGAWEQLVDPAERHHRRECLALQEAQEAAELRRDPIAILAAARLEAGAPSPRCRVAAVAGSYVVFLFMVETTIWLVRASIGH